MGFFKKHKDTVLTIAGAGMFLLGIAVVLFYIFKRCRSEFNADFTDTILWANAAVKSGRYFDPSYWYAYFLPFSGTLLMIPIVSALGLTYFAHQLGMALFAVIFAVALFVLMKTMDCTYAESFGLSGIVMIFMCSSQITRMIFYGHIIHYSLAIVFMCFAFAMLKKSDIFDPGSRRGLIFTVLIAVFCMLCTTNGVATLLLFFIPFFMSVVLERYFDARPITLKDDAKLIKSLAIIAAGALVGVMIKFVFFSSSEYENSITALLPSDGWVWKQSPFVLEWIKVLTDDSPTDVLMQSFSGIRILTMYMLALLLLVIPVFAAFFYRVIKYRMLRLLILFYWVMFATTLLSYSVSYASVSNWRLAGLVCAALILSLLYILYMLKEQLLVRWFVPVAAFFVPALFIAMLSVKNIPSAQNTNMTDQLIQLYDENSLTRGYSSSFWNSANSANVLSDGRISVSPITINTDGTYEVRRYQSEPSGYEDVEGVDRYFVVVDPQDMEFAADTLGANAVETIKYRDDIYIWVFDRNIFSDLEPVF